MSVVMRTPEEMSLHIATQVKTNRLRLNLSQKSLSKRSGVSFGVIKKFERLGQISLNSLLKLALALGGLGDFENVFKQPDPTQLGSLDALLKDQIRQRGRE